MDKYEYKIRSDEIKTLIAEGEFAEAVAIADTIDWRRVKSVMMLCTISDLYKINRRYQESKDILLLAYEKHPTGRLIVYSLCELSIKMEEYVQAIEYYKEFVQIAPKDTGRYILQYRLYEAQDVSLEERIAVLEEFKKRDYREKWAYELAYLYHRIGLSTKCVEECDEMFLWFGEGKYVIKALELKTLHVPLNADQQAKYDAWIRQRDGVEESPEEIDEEENADSVPGDTRVAGKIRHAEEENVDAEEIPLAPTMELPEVKTVDVGQYNTINLQMALAESMKEILNETVPDENVPSEEPEAGRDESVGADDVEYMAEIGVGVGIGEEENVDVQDIARDDIDDRNMDEEGGADQNIDEDSITDQDIDEDTAGNDYNNYNDIEEVTGELSETGEPEETKDDDNVSIAESLIAPLLEETARMPATEEVEKKLQGSQVIAFPGKAEPEPKDVQPERKLSMDTDELQEISTQIAHEDTAAFDAQQILEQMKQEAQQSVAESAADRIPGARTGVLTPLNTKPSRYDSILSQEYDGQISLVMPETERVEKQITGQLSIEDIMAEWEEMKKTNEQKRMEEVRQRIMAHTGNLFADFDEATKNGLLEELERAFVAAIMKDSAKKPAIKEVVLPDEDVEEKLAQWSDSEIEDHIVSTVEGFEERLHENKLDEKAAVAGEAAETSVQEPEPGYEEPEQQEVSAASTQDHMQDRELTEEEEELFGQFVHQRKSKRQLIHTLDNMSLASCTGNVLITGEEEVTALSLAKALIKEMQYSDGNFSGKVAKISANVLNKKDVAETLGRLDNGALIIEKASRLKPATVGKITKVLEKDNMGLLILLIDKKMGINQLLTDHAALSNNFNLRVDIEPMDDEALVAYAKQYAEEMEYSIDEFGILALHTRIADRQTSDHEVSMAEVRELVDEAISYANKKTPKHFMDILLAKRYDEEDMIILREKDFMHY